MTRFRSWLLARILGHAPNEAPAGVERFDREEYEHDGWKGEGK